MRLGAPRTSQSRLYAGAPGARDANQRSKRCSTGIQEPPLNGVHGLHFGNSRPCPLHASHSRRLVSRRSRQFRESTAFLRRAQNATDGGLMAHVEQKHGAQVLLADSITGERVWSVAPSGPNEPRGGTHVGPTQQRETSPTRRPSRSNRHDLQTRRCSGLNSLGGSVK